MIPINLLVISYLVIASIYVAISHREYSILFINGMLLLFLSMISFKQIDNHALYAWIGLIFLPLFYHEIGLANQKSKRETYDLALIAFEKKHFPRVMAFHQQNLANSIGLSEYLHACYLGFYIFIYGVPLYFYLRNEILFFYESTFAILYALLAGYITHIIIPVYGPRDIFQKINDKRSDKFFFKFVHNLLSKGSAAGTAFPSGHTSSTAVVLLMTWHLHTPLFYFLLPIGVGLIISTIYGRFHYVTDVIIGIGYAIMAFLVTVAIYD